MDISNTLFLMPGDLYFSSDDEYVMTILGSCLSVVFFDRKTKYTGVSHCLLPKQSVLKTNQSDNIFKYVDTTIQFMVEKFNEVGTQKRDLEIKIFGGASIHSSAEDSKMIVGKNNIITANEILNNLKLRVNKQDVGGNISRKIIVSTSNGDVFLKRM